MCAVKRYWSACERRASGDMFLLTCIVVATLDGANLSELAEQFAECRNVLIAFEQRRPEAEARISEVEQIVDRINDRRAVTVDDQIRSFVIVASDMQVGNAFGRHRRDEFLCVVA